MTKRDWKTVNPGGSRRVLVTKELPGDRWLQLLTAAECRVEIARGDDILAAPEIVAAFGDHADAAIGQLTEDWSAEVLGALRGAGALVYSQYAVGYDNVDVAAATRLGLQLWPAVGGLEDALPFVEDEKSPRAAPSIVNAVKPGLSRFAAGPPSKEDHQ